MKTALMETATAIKERPVLFSTPMVKAILERRKTMTRRVIRESFNGCLTNGGPHPCPNEPAVFYPGESYEDFFGLGEPIKVDYPEVRAVFHCSTLDSVAKCPYGKPGDILWVRETHYRYGFWVRNGLTKKGNQKWKFVAENDTVLYFDNPPATFKISRDKKDPLRPAWYKRLGRFMPKAACRLRLEIQSIGVELLQDITEEDAKREGSPMYVPGHGVITQSDVNSDPGYLNFVSCRMGFEHLWQSINGPESWNANPWVWRIEFRKL